MRDQKFLSTYFSSFLTYSSLHTQVYHNLVTRMATFGHIGPLSGVCEDLELYIEHSEKYLVPSDLDAIALSEDQPNKTAVYSRDAKRRAILLSIIWPQTYLLLQNIISTDIPATKTYSKPVMKLRDHSVPKPAEIVQRFKFHSRYRRTGESIADVLSELRKLAESSEQFRGLLRWYVARPSCLWRGRWAYTRRLLLESTLTLDKAYTMLWPKSWHHVMPQFFKQAATPTGANAITSDVEVIKISS